MKILNGTLSQYEGLRVALIPINYKRRPQITMSATSVTIHNTGCDGVPADNFKRSCHDKSQDKEVSYHFVVDEKEVIQLLPITEVGWHAGDRKGNYSSIGIEICERDGAEANAKKFIVELLKALSMNETHLRTHKSWSGKQCPHLILPHWNTFISDIRTNLYSSPQNNAQAVEKIKMSIDGRVTEVESVNVGGYNYVKLRDIACAKMDVQYDNALKMPVILFK